MAVKDMFRQLAAIQERVAPVNQRKGRNFAHLTRRAFVCAGAVGLTVMSERFTGDASEQVNGLLTRAYRPPFVMPPIG